MSWLDGFFTAIKAVFVGGAQVPTPGTPVGLNFTDGVTGAYNATTGNVDLTVTAAVVAGQNPASLSNGLNSNIATGGQPTVRLAGPSAAFSVGGFQLPGAATPQAGQQLVILYAGAQALTVIHEDLSSAAVARVATPTGQNYTFPAGPRSFTLVYDGALNRLVLQNVGVVSPTSINITANGDGVTDCTAAIQVAITQAIAAKCKIVFPAGTYIFSSTLDFTGATGVYMEGLTTRASGVNGVVLQYTGTGSQAIKAPNSVGFGVRQMHVYASNTGFAGTLIDLSAPSGETAFAHFEHAGFFGSGPTHGSWLFLLSNTDSISFEHCVFSNCDTAVVGILASGEFANNVSFRQCAVVAGGAGTHWYRNPSASWSWDNCVFEPLASGVADGVTSDPANPTGTAASYTLVGTTVTMTGLSGINKNISSIVVSGFATGGNNGTFTPTYVSESSVSYTNGSATSTDANNGSGHWATTQGFILANSLSVAKCWCGDATNPGTWANIICSGSHFSGNTFSSAGLAIRGTGAHVVGNTFVAMTTAVAFSNGSSGVFFYGNTLGGVTNSFTGSITGIVQDLSGNPILYGETINYLPYKAKAHNSGTGSITAGGWHQIPLDVVDFDSNGNFAANAYTVPVSGYYQINATYESLLDSGAYCQCQPYVNGSTIFAVGSLAASSGGIGGSQYADLVYLNAGDVVTLFGSQSSAGSQTVYSGRMSLHYMTS